jgi:hypothetical protein
MEPTRIPASLNEEDVFTLHMSTRQLVIVVVGALLWFGAGSFSASIIGVNMILTMIFFSWIFFGGLALAFMRVDGMKLDGYLGEKFNFELHPKTYILKEEGLEEEDDDLIAAPFPQSLHSFNREPVTVRLMDLEDDNV